MQSELKRDILKLFSDGERKKSYSLRGVDGLDSDDLNSLLSLCRVYERDGELGGWKEKITHQRIADVLIKYGMW